MAKYNFATGAGSMYHLKDLTRREISQLRVSQFSTERWLHGIAPPMVAMGSISPAGKRTWHYVPLYGVVNHD